MTLQEKIDLAVQELEMSKRMVKHHREEAIKWENLIDIREHAVATLKSELPKPTKKDKKQ